MNDDTLTLYYYDDGLTDAERRRVEAALASDEALAARYRALCRELDDLDCLDTSTTAPAHVVARWHAGIDRAAASRSEPERRSHLFHLPSFVWGSAITVALVVGVGIGYLLSTSQAPSPIPETAVTRAPATESRPDDAFARGLKVHLAESRNEITDLSLSADAERVLLIMQIIEQNRLFERAADQRNSPELARVLRAFEPILLRLAADDIAPEDAEALRAKLAFELNVMLTKLSRDLSDESHSI